MVLNVLLTRFRKKISNLMNILVRPLARAGVPPNIVTIFSMILLITFLLIYYYIWPNTFVLLAGIIVSALCDAIDGALARYLNKVSRFGAFLDSTIDRVNDLIMLLFLKFVGIDDLLVYSLVLTSFLISYVRARAESLGIAMEGIGFIERAERVLIITFILLVSTISLRLAHLLSYIFLVLSIITLLQRIYHVYKSS